jgi:hypothetical protein
MSFHKHAILGFTEHRKLAPFADPAWLIKGINDLYYEFPETPFERVEWYQVHDWKRPDIPPRPPSVGDFSEGPPHPRDPNHVLWLAETAKHCPVYLMEPPPEVPDAKILPREAIYAYFRDATDKPVKYFTNSVSWMIAMSIMELAPESNGRRPLYDDATIGVWGVDMMVAGGAGSEYGWQRPSVEWLLGYAMGAGIKVHIPRESELLKTAFDYGDTTKEYFRHLVYNRRQQMSAQRGQMHNQLQQAQLAAAELTGYINACDQLLRNHMPGDPGEEVYLSARVPMPDSHKNLAPGLTGTVPFDNGEGNIA